MKQFDCIPALRALGEQKRLAILRLLFEQPLTVNSIAERLDETQYTVSKHLKTMLHARLLSVQQKGRFRYYSISPALKRKTRGDKVLDLNCCTFDLGKLSC